MTESNKICVEVAYALPDKQEIVMLEVLPGTTAAQAVSQSAIFDHFPDLLHQENARLGVFGKAVKDDYVLHAGERVEIYRPLIADPKEVRKERAAKARRKRVSGESVGTED
jgi:putative ubiquitin-RnfH superfamily antitoxin RatB of RatAB toxin-antitoxin module